MTDLAEEPYRYALARAEDRAAEAATDLALEREAHRRTHIELVTLRHRIARGLCPECDYGSRLLAAHVTRDHPTFDSDAV